MFILMMLQEVNLTRSLRSVTSSVIVTRSLVTGFGMMKIERSSAARMLCSTKKRCTR